MNFLKYLRTWAFFAAGLLILTAGINWLVDPFGFLGGPRIENFNAKKTKVPAHEQMSAAIEIMQQKPKVLIMGTSRAQVETCTPCSAISNMPMLSVAWTGLSSPSIFLFSMPIGSPAKASGKNGWPCPQIGNPIP
jgi:hypothetical protein